jgi:hypothetical protein
MSKAINKLPKGLEESYDVDRATRMRIVDGNSEQTYAAKARARRPHTEPRSQMECTL